MAEPKIYTAVQARALLAAATPGPWHLSADKESITHTSHITRDVWTLPRTHADMELVAAAPDLVASVEHYAGQLEEERALRQAAEAERDRLAADLEREKAETLAFLLDAARKASVPKERGWIATLHRAIELGLHRGGAVQRSDAEAAEVSGG